MKASQHPLRNAPVLPKAKRTSCLRKSASILTKMKSLPTVNLKMNPIIKCRLSFFFLTVHSSLYTFLQKLNKIYLCRMRKVRIFDIPDIDRFFIGCFMKSVDRGDFKEFKDKLK